NVETLQGFEKLIQACWQFSRGNSLTLAEKLLPECMASLQPIALQPSLHQQQAAQLAAKGFQIHGLLALHRNDLPAKERYNKQAVQYAALSGDHNLLITSLRQLADTYRYSHQYPQLVHTYTEALQHVDKASPLLQSCIYRGMAIAYA